jgi:hypothetical protein
MKWISCSSQLPDVGKHVLIFTKEGFQVVAWFSGSRWYLVMGSESWSQSDVSHWKYLEEDPTT